ncbi:hypothetical protein EVAR_44690_1 [Eumeta japonica]|uniref:Uncharacterized protein n=1 Tax=Eumeta variegata TaxID=151549 RepID=A0A4C1XKU4_EUMVA|nr:hypothetical protein EVAR_44690_1 [Eumeta japonica]
METPHIDSDPPLLDTQHLYKTWVANGMSGTAYNSDGLRGGTRGGGTSSEQVGVRGKQCGSILLLQQRREPPQSSRSVARSNMSILGGQTLRKSSRLVTTPASSTHSRLQRSARMRYTDISPLQFTSPRPAVCHDQSG